MAFKLPVQIIVTIAALWVLVTAAMYLFPTVKLNVVMLIRLVAFSEETDVLEAALTYRQSVKDYRGAERLIQIAVDNALDWYWRMSGFLGLLMGVVLAANYVIHKYSFPFGVPHDSP